MTDTGAVLVLGDDVRSFLGVVRSLARRGLRVDVIAQDQSSPALRSRYIANHYRLPPYPLKLGDWISTLQDILEQRRYDLIVPCDDRTILPLMAHREQLGIQRIALPNEAAYGVFFDKHATRSLADNLGIPVAPGRSLSEDDTADALVEAFGLPLVVKSGRSYRLETLSQRGKVSICQTEAEARNALSATDPAINYLVEGFFAGQGVGISVLADQGEILLAFQHGRLRESASGGSSFRESMTCDPRLLDAVTKLAGTVRLHGVAMFEFRHNARTGDFILVEVNARFWGSLPLALAAGIDFPAALFDLLVENERPKGSNYRTGVRARNVTADLNAAMANGGSTFLQGLNFVGGCLNMLIGREVHDSFSWRDSAPWRAEIAELFHQASRKLGGAIPGATGRRKKQAGEIVKQRSAGPILILCQGNICRSPYAAAKLRTLAPRLEVPSAGLMERTGRHAPELALQSAADRGVDLSAHQSAYADDDALAAAGLIVVFDAINTAGLKARGLSKNAKIIGLGDLTGDGAITDPVDGTADDFARCYDQIDRSVEELARLLDEPTP